MAKKSKKNYSVFDNNDRNKFYNKMSSEQKELYESIKSSIFVFCEATAGTGKTTVAVNAMLDLLFANKINHIIYIQKVSERFLQHGFLPGTIEEKTDALWTPFYEAMATLGYQPESVDKFIEQESIILTTDSNLRGVNFEKCGVILDECSNMNTETLKLILTRCHDNCHIIMIGDSLQKDNKGHHNVDFVSYGNYLSNMSFGTKCILTKNYRGKFSQAAENFSMEGL